MKSMVFTVSRTRAIIGVVAAACISYFAITQPALGQEELKGRLMFGVKPLQNANLDSIQAQSAAGTGLKVWTYKVTSTRTGSKGKGFTGVMVGNSPISTNGTTTTTVYVVPLIFDIGGHTFDPTVADSSCLAGKVPETVLKNSPMVLATHDFKVNGVDMGKTQYSDAFQRANFWKDVSGMGGTYHNKLSYKFLAAKTVKPGAAHSALAALTGACTAFYGGVEINWFDSHLTGTVIPSLAASGVGPTNLVAFMLYNVTMYIGTTSDCCVGGYHSAFGSPAQTYAPFQFDSADFFSVDSEDTDIMSHEIDEWQDDPLGNNPTPAWGHVGQQTGCQTNLEVGDPLTNKNFPNVTMNGFTYHLQELAFFNWFFGGPSIGASGKFSDHGTFTSAQGPCT
jgi:hypothetical protein